MANYILNAGGSIQKSNKQFFKAENGTCLQFPK